MTKRQAAELNRTMAQFGAIAPTATGEDFDILRRASMTLRRWHERECGIDGGCIERDETTGRAYWHSSYSGRRTPIRDMETGARRRIADICKRLSLYSYIQTDPRGAALYVSHQPLTDSDYSRGLCIG